MGKDKHAHKCCAWLQEGDTGLIRAGCWAGGWRRASWVPYTFCSVSGAATPPAAVLSA